MPAADSFVSYYFPKPDFPKAGFKLPRQFIIKMEKDYLPSQKYSIDLMEELNIPYTLQDSCVDLMVEY